MRQASQQIKAFSFFHAWSKFIKLAVAPGIAWLDSRW